ncbi:MULTISPECIES: clostripain-related cysteine peptidase [Prevotella]|uniref:Clostripain family protein n=1 Tax=Prevotella herbatica TaxID=2801997 RepID=A0ABM7P1Z5_9BACT|nr:MULTISPECIES: clostripain-related cysteine peptidase [Prevotella]MDN5553419.1 clostripain-related cysteine peptidase [Prevotella sp.]BCS86755.1 hypothetical protein prwr041_26480 [Prevotella herbatica]
MKKILTLLFVTLTAFSLVGCDHDDPRTVYQYENTTKTIFVYMPWTGSTTSSNGALTDYFDINITSMENAINTNGGLKGTDVIVYKANSASKAVMFRMKYNITLRKCELDTLVTNASNNAITKENLTSLLNQVSSYSNTGLYSILVGCHGSGWTPRGSDATMPRASRAFGGQGSELQYDLSDLSYAIANSAMKKVEFVSFDDCYMANVETAYELRDVTNYLVASTSEVMGDGFPYDTLFKYMLGTPDYDNICKTFYNYYIKSSYPYGALSVIKCGDAIKQMASVMKDINTTYTFDQSKLSSVQYLDGYDNNVFFDLGSYVEQLGVIAPLSANFNTALEKLVPYTVYTPYIYTAYSNSYRSDTDPKNPYNTFMVKTFSGVTISDPTLNLTVVNSKKNTTWWQATH